MTESSSSFSTPPHRMRKRRTVNQSPALSVSNSSLLENNDDYQEKRLRRKSKILTNNVLSPGGVQASPSRNVQKDKEKRKSINLSHAGMSNVQIKEHYANCIKLSSENKINVKNAFGLHLIDYMKDLLKQSQKEDTGTNFQVASCTLDAGVKIYAYRVDSVHNEAYKVLGSLGRVVENAENEDGEMAGSQDNPSQQNPVKKTRKKGSGKTIETNLKNINSDNIDIDFEIDPFFTKIASSCDEAGTTSLLSFHLNSKSDMNDIMLDSYTVVSDIPIASVGESSDEDMVDLNDLRDVYNKMNADVEICPQFSSFKFKGWDKDSQGIGGDVSLPDDSFDGDNVHRFDENAPVIQDAMESFDTGGGPADDDDGFNIEDTNDILDDVKFDGQAASLQDGIISKGSLINATGSSHLALSLNPSEYSYFSQEILSMWAGPLHWKVKAKSKDKNATSDKGSTKSITKKTQLRIDFDEEIDMKKCFTTGRAATHLKESTLEKYAAQMSVLPADLHYETDNLYKLSMRTFVSIKRQLDAKELKDEGGEWYNYDNKNDREGFCPEIDDDDIGGGGYDDDDDDIGMTGAGGTPQHLTFGGDSLVAPPNKIRVLNINYAKAAKRIDIKRLKGTMWKLLTENKSNDKENIEKSNLPTPQIEEEEKDESTNNVTGTYTFKSMYEALPNNVSSNMAKNLSSPIAFVCLLYLANEKCLKLTGKEDMSDIKIEEGL